MPLSTVTGRIAEFDPKKQAFTLIDEFKKFAFKGNVIDLAVGVIIGGAFTGIVNSLVKNVIMPLIAALLPGQEKFVDWTWTIRGKEIPYGHFVGEVVNFLLVAGALFLFTVKFLGWMMRNKKAEAAAPPPPTKDQELLMEIRDLLKNSAAKP